MPSRIGSTPLSIEKINTWAAKHTIFGWLAGLAFWNWFASDAVHVVWWGHLILIIGGVFASSLIIGFGMTLLAGLITKIITGRAEGSPHVFAWAAYISPVLAFFAAKYALLFSASL